MRSRRFAAGKYVPALVLAAFVAVVVLWPEFWVHAAAFGIAAIAIHANTEALRSARRDAESRSEQLVRLNARLKEHVEEVQVLSENMQEQNLHLEQARQAAESAMRSREDVLAIVAHALRNPLNLVMMTTQLILDIDPSEERRRELLGVMQRAAQRMN